MPFWTTVGKACPTKAHLAGNTGPKLRGPTTKVLSLESTKMRKVVKDWGVRGRFGSGQGRPSGKVPLW